MKKIFKTYRSTILLVLSIVLGCVIGLLFKEDAAVLKPLGDIFLNLLFVSIVPLIFLTITTTFSKIKQISRFRKIIGFVFLFIVLTSLVAVGIGFLFTNLFPFVSENAISISNDGEAVKEGIHFLERTKDLLTVSDFSLLLSKDHMIALFVVSVLVGLSIRSVGKEADPLVRVLESANHVVIRFIELLMYYAPIGLGCYFAYLVGTFGGEIAKGYVQTFLLYLVATVVTYFGVYSFYAYLAGGKKGVKSFWKTILPCSFTALGTCSSAASIPVNIQTAKKIGVKDEIAEMAVPLGTTFHKDGSIIGSVFKIMFLVYLFQLDLSVFEIIFTSLVATLLVTAVPIGGGTISEAFIISLVGAPMTALPLLTVIATIIDPPATLLNVVGDTTVSMLTARAVDGPNWQKKES